MLLPPPMPPDPRDESHLNALKICYYISAGLGGVGLLFLIFHYAIFNSIFGSEEFLKSTEKEEAAMMKGEMDTMVWFYGVIGLLIVIVSVLDTLCGRAIAQRRNPILVQVVAGINCLSIPLGTVLGVFTFIILARPAVCAQFERN